MLRIFSVILYIFGGVYFIFLGIIVIVISLTIGHQALYRILPFLTRIQLFFLGSWINLKNKIPKQGQYIIMMNHSSFADVFFSVQPLRGKYTAILAAFNFKIPIWGKMLKHFRAIPIHRKNHLKAISSIKKAENLIKDLGYHIVIFPEGTRTIDGNLQKFKKGAFHMAINTKIPILPIAIKGGFKYKPKTRWYIKPSIISIEVGDPIQVDSFSNKNIDDLVNQTYNEFNRLLNK